MKARAVQKTPANICICGAQAVHVCLDVHRFVFIPVRCHMHTRMYIQQCLPGSGRGGLEGSSALPGVAPGRLGTPGARPPPRTRTRAGMEPAGPGRATRAGSEPSTGLGKPQTAPGGKSPSRKWTSQPPAQNETLNLI